MLILALRDKQGKENKDGKFCEASGECGFRLVAPWLFLLQDWKYLVPSSIVLDRMRST